MPLSFARGNRFMLASIVLIVFCGTSLLLWLTLTPRKPAQDTLLTQAYEKVKEVHAYTQNVQTEVQLSDRRIQVDGIYVHNGAESRFSSVATTTLLIPTGRKSEAHSFTLRNISIFNDVYTKIDTESEILRSTIPTTPTWQHFNKDAIPDRFVNIAVSGPVLDNLLIFNENGAYLELVASYGLVKWSEENLEKYELVLSKSTPFSVGGTLGTLLNRIGKDGTITLWVDPETAIIRHFVFTGDNYLSTTTISAINTPPLIAAPTD